MHRREYDLVCCVDLYTSWSLYVTELPLLIFAILFYIQSTIVSALIRIYVCANSSAWYSQIYCAISSHLSYSCSLCQPVLTFLNTRPANLKVIILVLAVLRFPFKSHFRHEFLSFYDLGTLHK